MLDNGLVPRSRGSADAQDQNGCGYPPHPIPPRLLLFAIRSSLHHRANVRNGSKAAISYEVRAPS